MLDDCYLFSGWIRAGIGWWVVSWIVRLLQQPASRGFVGPGQLKPREVGLGLAVSTRIHSDMVKRSGCCLFFWGVGWGSFSVFSSCSNVWGVFWSSCGHGVLDIVLVKSFFLIFSLCDPCR